MCSPHQIRYEKWGGGRCAVRIRSDTKRGGGAVHFRSNTKKVGGGGGGGAVHFRSNTKSVCGGGGGGEGQSISGPMPFFGTQKIHHR